MPLIHKLPSPICLMPPPSSPSAHFEYWLRSIFRFIFVSSASSIKFTCIGQKPGHEKQKHRRNPFKWLMLINVHKIKVPFYFLVPSNFFLFAKILLFHRRAAVCWIIDGWPLFSQVAAQCKRPTMNQANREVKGTEMKNRKKNENEAKFILNYIDNWLKP